MQAISEQAKPAATMNTCGAMMVGSNLSKDACNDGMEANHLKCVCSGILLCLLLLGKLLRCVCVLAAIGRSEYSRSV